MPTRPRHVLTRAERQRLERDADIARIELSLREQAPALFYVPHEKGQRQFHTAPHKKRCLWPGNRFGKTTAMAIEADHFLQHRVREGWHRVKPWPQQVIWFCPQYEQFEELRPQLESECFTQGWKWNESRKRYTWPDGGRLKVFSSGMDWGDIQGINPDLICVDEETDANIWRELQARGFGKKKTRYIIAATATKGLSWMYFDLYLPWLDHHKGLGHSEEEAMALQLHPDTWAWSRGGIQDNPSMTEADVEGFHRIVWGSSKEKAVRDAGGFQSLAGDCIFDAEDLLWEEEQCEQYAANPDPAYFRGSLVIAEEDPLPLVWN